MLPIYETDGVRVGDMWVSELGRTPTVNRCANVLFNTDYYREQYKQSWAVLVVQPVDRVTVSLVSVNNKRSTIYAIIDTMNSHSDTKIVDSLLDTHIFAKLEWRDNYHFKRHFILFILVYN